ncbi:mutator type transposase, partial [Tanacetum coccineum]
MVLPLYDIRANDVHDRDPYKMYSLKLVSVFVEHEKNSEGQSIGKNLKGQNSGKDKGQTSGKNFEGQSSAVGIAGSSQVPNQIVNHFYSSYDPYEESQDPNFDPFADLDLILPTYRNMEGNTSENVDLVDTTNNVETKGDEERQGEEETKVDEERHGEEETKVDEERHGEEETEVEDESDSKDSDYLVDEDNNVDDIDVDMEDFEYNIDEEVEFVGCRDKEQPPDIEGDAEEIEVLDNDYFESASDSDDDEFPNKEEVKAYIKEHSIETRREIRLEKKDNERVRAICKGVIPSLPTFKDIGNGPSQCSGPSQASGSKEKWTKKKNAMARSPSKDKLTKEKLINGGKPNRKKQMDDNKCPWVVLVSKIKNTETWQ